jgi:hypothetical protein
MSTLLTLLRVYRCKHSHLVGDTSIQFNCYIPVYFPCDTFTRTLTIVMMHMTSKYQIYNLYFLFSLRVSVVGCGGFRDERI